LAFTVFVFTETVAPSGGRCVNGNKQLVAAANCSNGWRKNP